jgi:hypothetical protein
VLCCVFPIPLNESKISTTFEELDPSSPSKSGAYRLSSLMLLQEQNELDSKFQLSAMRYLLSHQTHQRQNKISNREVVARQNEVEKVLQCSNFHSMCCKYPLDHKLLLFHSNIHQRRQDFVRKWLQVENKE